MGIKGEVDFPRGGAPITDKPPSTVEKKKGKKDEEALFGIKRKNKAEVSIDGDVTKKKRAEKEVDEYAGVWAKHVTSEDLTEGMLGVGVIREVKELELTLETAYGVYVTLPANHISKAFTAKLKSGEIGMDDVFKVGQMIAFRVVKKMVDNGFKGKVYPIVTCNPQQVNNHLVPARCVVGLVLTGTVKSIEEKGALIDLGVSGLNGFLNGVNNLVVGQPVMSRIESISTRIVKLSPHIETENLNQETIDNLQLNNLMPGTILYADPEKSTAHGVYVTLGNGVHGFISRKHLPPRLRADLSRMAKALRVVVLFCQQNSNFLVLSAHPDIIAISKTEKRTSFEGLNVGDTISCRVAFIAPNNKSVFFELPEDDNGKASLVTAIASQKYLENPEKLDTIYVPGSEHQCRVLSYSLMERSLNVAAKKSVLHQKMVSFKDAKVGEKVDATVEKITTCGIRVKIYDHLNGFIFTDLATDRGAAHLEKLFTVGQILKCRITGVNPGHSNVVLTCRPQLVNANNIIKSYDKEHEGQNFVGVIATVLSTGGAVVRFFNDVAGLLPKGEVQRLGAVKRGQQLEVRVDTVDVDNRKMSLMLADQIASGQKGIIKSQPISYATPGARLYSGITGDVSEIMVGGKRTEVVKVALDVPKSKDVTVTISKALATDCLDSPFDALTGTFNKGTKMEKVAPLGAGKACHKFFVRDWMANPLNKVPKKLDDLVIGDVVCGVVSQRIPEMGYFVELVGGSGIIGKAPIENIDEGKFGELALQTGQTVLAKVSKINLETKSVALNLHPGLSFPESPLDLPIAYLKSVVEEQGFLANMHSLPIPGTIVKATVTQVIDDVVVVTFGSNNNTGVARTVGEASPPKVGAKVSCAVIDFQYPIMSAELVIVPEQKKDNKKSKKNSDDKARVVLVKRDYIVAVSPGGKIHFVPARLHPNIVSEKKGRFTLGKELEIIETNLSVENANLSTVKGDSAIAAKLINSSAADGKVSKDGKSSFAIKNFTIYTATVYGPYHSTNEENEKGVHAIQVMLPGGILGRLHASELPESIMVEGTNPVAEFLDQNKGKQVNVKVIGFSKKGEKRMPELTIRPSKLQESKKKAGLLSYPIKYNSGDLIPVFSKAGNESAAMLKFEVSPEFNAVLPRERLPEELLKVNPTNKSNMVDIGILPGEVRLAKVVGCNRHKKTLEITFVEQEPLSVGDHVTGRVSSISQSPIGVNLQLSNGQSARIGPTGVVGAYKKAISFLKTFNIGELYHVVIGADASGLSSSHEIKHKWDVVSESRWEKKDSPKTANRLLIGVDDITKDDELRGFVLRIEEKSIVIELGCGVVAAVNKLKNEVPVNVNDLVMVKVLTVNPEKETVHVKIDHVVDVASPSSTPVPEKRKRTASTSSAAGESEDAKKQRMAEAAGYAPVKENKTVEVEKIVEQDPGWDFSNEGFRPQDLAKVSKLNEAEVSRMSALEKEKENEKKKSKEEEHKKEKKQKKNLTKEELAVEHEKELVAAESRLAEGELPETDEEFGIMLKRQPNSAALWIRYISFFLEKDDLVTARSTAERALQMINYREDSERLALWTAYLNMEVSFGTSETIKTVFEKACGNADSLKIHKQLAAIYAKSNKIEEADEIYDQMIKRFRALSDEVWILYGEHLMCTERADQARELLKRAFASVPKTRHPQLISRFATLEFSKGDAERGRTLFESVLNNFPKKTDIWTVYVDLTIKHGNEEHARQVLDRVCSLPLSMHKLRPFYKKWMEFEEKHGDERTQAEVREKADKYLQEVAKDTI